MRTLSKKDQIYCLIFVNVICLGTIIPLLTEYQTHFSPTAPLPTPAPGSVVDFEFSNPEQNYERCTNRSTFTIQVRSNSGFIPVVKVQVNSMNYTMTRVSYDENQGTFFDNITAGIKWRLILCSLANGTYPITYWAGNASGWMKLEGQILTINMFPDLFDDPQPWGCGL